ncbi:MAG: hypothetical protein AB1918_01060 [Pseudomonadota bacterium]
MIVRRRKAAKAAREQAREALWRDVVVRRRGPGHLRFDLPTSLVTPSAAATIEAGLRRVDGVYRVTVFAGMGKLSVRWSEPVCGQADVVRALAAAVATVADEIGDRPVADSPLAVPAPSQARPGFLARIKGSRTVLRLRERYDEMKTRVDAVNHLIALKTGRASPLPFDAKEWAIHFVNDLVAFYLIRVHWERITRQWLPSPWTYRYQWMAVIYLTFLLVRHRKSTAPKVTRK